MFSNLFVTNCFSQTYCYKYLYSINSDEEKVKNENESKVIYINFTRDKKYFHFSDRNGYKEGSETYVYTSKSSKGVKKYEDKVVAEPKPRYKKAEGFGMFPMPPVLDGEAAADRDWWAISGKEIFFSSDYSRINIHYIGKSFKQTNTPVAVYELTSAETPEDFDMY